MLQVFKLLSLLVVLACLPAPGEAQTPPDESAHMTSVDAAGKQALETTQVVGATVAIIKNGRLFYTRGFGWRDAARGLRADVATRYEVGSVTKQFTAAAILQLKEAGKLELDARLATYLPGVAHAEEVTISQLLSLTSGFPDYMSGNGVEAFAGMPTTFDQLMSSIAGKPLDFQPGTKFGASNTNYLILGRVVEAVSGETWDAYARKHLFAPAGMAQSSTIAGEPNVPNMAHGYAFATGKTSPALPLDESWASATGDIVTTVGDLAKWDAALASGTIISQDDYELLATSAHLADGSSTGHGYGLYVDGSALQPRLLAQGDTFGFDASDVLYRRQNIRVIVLTNTADRDSGASCSMEIADAVHEALSPNPAASAPAQALYSATVAAMDQLPQAPFISYTLEGQSSGVHLALETVRHEIWLAFQAGSGSNTWIVKHRTQDYESEVLDGVPSQRYVSKRSFFDPTWFGAYRALRDGMLGYQNVALARQSPTPAPPLPASDPQLKTIAAVSVMGPGIYTVTDRGPASCANGDAGHALHLTSRRRDPRHQLTDVVVDLGLKRFCTLRFTWSTMLFSGIVEQQYASVGGYWTVSEGSIDGTFRTLGIATHHFIWSYRLTHVTFPEQIPASTFVPDPAQ